MPRARLAVVLVAALCASPARGQLDPNGFASLGTLNHPSGGLTINTDTLTISGAITFTGVALSQNGGPQVAVFDFDSITIGSAATVTLTGSRPLALLSRGNATIQSALNVPTGLNGAGVPFLGGYAGGYVIFGGNNAFQDIGQGGSGPGGGGAMANPGGSGAGGVGHGGKGGPTLGGLSGVPYGSLPQILQGGSGGGAVARVYAESNLASAEARAGAGGGSMEVVTTGTLTIAAMSAVGTAGSGSAQSDSSTGVPSFFLAAGGAGGGILLSGGTGLTLTGSLDARGGDASASTGIGNTSGGGGGRIALSGLSTYTLGTIPSGTFNLNGGNGAGNGFAGVITVDALSTTIPSGTSVTLDGTPIVSVAGSTTQTVPTIEAYARRDLNVSGTVILGANNAFRRFDAVGNNVTSLLINGGTFDLNGFSQAVDTFNQTTFSGGLVKLPAGSTFTVGVNGSGGGYFGQFTGGGALVKAGTGQLALFGGSPNFAGQTTITGGTLAVRNDQALADSTVLLAGGTLSLSAVVSNNPVLGALAGTTNLSVAPLNNSTGVTVGANNASTTYSGNLSGSIPAGLIKAGTGTWTLTGTNTQSGPFNIQAGTVLIGSPGALAPSNSVSVSAGATLDLNGYSYTVTSGNAWTVQGNLRLGGAGLTVGSGATATYNGGFVSNGFLRGSGTQSVTGGATLSGITTLNSTGISQTGAGTLTDFTNGGTLTVAGGLSAGVTFDGFTNQGSGAIGVGAGTNVSASDFENYGLLTLGPGSAAAPSRLTNTGLSPLYFNGGSRTFIGTPQTAGQNLVLVDLHGHNAVVAGGLFVNNGFVGDSTASGAAIVADFGALVKGAGTFQSAVITQNGGKFQAGNSPGSASFGRFVFGPGGVDNYVFAIDDAAGAAGPKPDALGHVSGWSLVQVLGRADTVSPPVPGDFAWTATPAARLALALNTLVNPTTVGTDVPGPMAEFDPTRPYSWPAVHWTGTYAGPADAAVLDAATSFDTNGFLNPIAGTFGWWLDSADRSLSLTYTPTAVPEPGTLALAGFATFAWQICRRRAGKP
jgi:fibronectin-binding autotransporter adhesin